MENRILLISNNGQGFYNFKKELIEQLLAQGFEVYFSVPKYEKLIELEKKGAKYKELLIDRRGMNPIKDLGFIRRLYHIIKSVKPTVVVLHTIKPNIYGSLVCKICKIPYINNITGLGSALQTNSKLAKILRSMYKFTLNKSNGIFFENEGNCNYFRHYKIGKEEVYHCVKGAGVNIEYFNEEHLNEKNEKDLITKNEVVFLYIARVMKEKGIEEFLSMAENVKRTEKAARFQILGYYDEEKYKKLIQELDKKNIVEYLGVSNDTRIEMNRADCIVLPSYHEGMSNVLLEGAAFAKPLITTNIHGCKEAVDDGKTGFLCIPKDTQSLTDAVLKFLLLTPEERTQMGKQGRQKMIKEFDRNMVTKKYIKIINKIIGK